MRARLAGFLVFCILLIYTIPIFYEAILEKRLLKASISIAAEMRDLRALVLSLRSDHSMIFESGDISTYKAFIDKNSNGILDRTETLIRELNLDASFPGIKFIEFTKEGGMSLLNKKTIVMSYLKPDTGQPISEERLFLINKRDLDKGIYKRISSISWDPQSKDIKVFRYNGVDGDNTIVLKEI